MTVSQYLREIGERATLGTWHVGFSDGSGAGEDADGYYITTGSPKNPNDDTVVVRAGSDDRGVPRGVVRKEDATAIVVARNLWEQMVEVVARRDLPSLSRPDDIHIWCDAQGIHVRVSPRVRTINQVQCPPKR